MAPGKLRVTDCGSGQLRSTRDPRSIILVIKLSLLILALVSCSQRRGQESYLTGAATSGTTSVSTKVISHLSYPYYPMFTLTPFDPTATPAQRPIPPLAEGLAIVQDPSLPFWIDSIWPAPGSEVPLASLQAMCVRPASIFLHELYPQLLDIFNAGERARDHLQLEVNGVVPSELTWHDIIMPNSTNPGTAWIGTWTYAEFCWPAELGVGRHQVRLTYPDGADSGLFRWSFTAVDD